MQCCEVLRIYAEYDSQLLLHQILALYPKNGLIYSQCCVCWRLIAFDSHLSNRDSVSNKQKKTISQCILRFSFIIPSLVTLCDTGESHSTIVLLSVKTVFTLETSRYLKVFTASDVFLILTVEQKAWYPAVFTLMSTFMHVIKANKDTAVEVQFHYYSVICWNVLGQDTVPIRV